ncbi:hypothetical protein Tco_1099406 [Tanacetum coccineum]
MTGNPCGLAFVSFSDASALNRVLADTHTILGRMVTLRNYIHNNDKEDMMFTTIEQHPNYIPPDELHDVRGHETNTENVSQGTSNEMKRIRDDIATSIWNARRQ